jgi:enterobacteria phage integrase
MAPARRNRKRRDWPRGLYEARPGYFVYREPGADGKQHTIGEVEEDDAIHQALLANEHFRKGRVSLLDKITGAAHTVADLLKEIPAATKTNTLKSNRSLDKKIVAAIGAVACAKLETKHCADVIEAEAKAGKARSAQALRSRLIVMCQRGLELGWLKNGNVAEDTRRPDAEVQRGRLSLEMFQAIYAAAPQVNEWLQGAMMLALVTGQDRVTVATMQRKHVQVIDGQKALVVNRSKTEATNEPFAIPLSLRLDVVGMTLEDVLQSQANIRSAHFVHHRQNYGNAPMGAPIFPDNISRSFTTARELAGIPDVLPDGKGAPTFHEIRSLSKRLYDKQGGVDTKALLGHASETASALYAKTRGSEIALVKVG